MKPGDWLGLLRPGDWLVAVLALAAVVASYPLLWRAGSAERAVVRLDGRIVAEYPLNVRRSIEVRGPLGPTVVEIEPGRARVRSDPGPRQYCVKQGWLVRANAVAICAPNHVSLMLVGKASAYDSLSY